MMEIVDKLSSLLGAISTCLNVHPFKLSCPGELSYSLQMTLVLPPREGILVHTVCIMKP